jgi:hypothetical protein
MKRNRPQITVLCGGFSYEKWSVELSQKPKNGILVVKLTQPLNLKERDLVVAINWL